MPISLELTNVAMQMLEGQDAAGARVAVVVFVDAQSGMQIVIPFDAVGARKLAAHLEGRPHVEIAHGLNGGSPLRHGLNGGSPPRGA